MEGGKGKAGVRVSVGMNLSSISLCHVTLSKMFPPLSPSFLIYGVVTMKIKMVMIPTSMYKSYSSLNSTFPFHR